MAFKDKLKDTLAALIMRLGATATERIILDEIARCANAYLEDELNRSFPRCVCWGACNRRAAPHGILPHAIAPVLELDIPFKAYLYYDPQTHDPVLEYVLQMRVSPNANIIIEQREIANLSSNVVHNIASYYRVSQGILQVRLGQP